MTEYYETQTRIIPTVKYHRVCIFYTDNVLLAHIVRVCSEPRACRSLFDISGYCRRKYSGENNGSIPLIDVSEQYWSSIVNRVNYSNYTLGFNPKLKSIFLATCYKLLT